MYSEYEVTKTASVNDDIFTCSSGDIIGTVTVITEDGIAEDRVINGFLKGVYPWHNVYLVQDGKFQFKTYGDSYADVRNSHRNATSIVYLYKKTVIDDEIFYKDINPEVNPLF